MKLHLYRSFILIFDVPCPEGRIEWLPKVLSYKRIFVQPLLKMFEVHSFICVHLFNNFLPEFDILLSQIFVLLLSSLAYTCHWNVIRIRRKRATIAEIGFGLIWVVLVAQGFVGRLGRFRTINIKTLRWFVRQLVHVLQIRIEHLDWAHLLFWLTPSPLLWGPQHVLLAMVSVPLALVIRKCAKTWFVEDVLQTDVIHVGVDAPFYALSKLGILRRAFISESQIRQTIQHNHHNFLFDMLFAAQVEYQENVAVQFLIRGSTQIDDAAAEILEIDEEFSLGYHVKGLLSP